MTTTTASSTPTKTSKSWETLRQETYKEIMNTDVLCEVLFPSDLNQKKEATAYLEEAFAMMRSFEQHYSRFVASSELSVFNQSEGRTLSPEFFDILTQAKHFHQYTHGLFDPSILPALEKEGYPGIAATLASEKRSFSELHLDPQTHTATKPRDLRIDLGGIGKGYIVDRVASFLSQRFEHFLIDAGGDIYAQGSNIREGYPYWAIEVEHPLNKEEAATLLLLTHKAVATSGRNRRHWRKDGQKKHHIIDPRTSKSADSTFLSVTVLADNVMTADVLAKTLFIAGPTEGPLLAEQWNIPALFIDQEGIVTLNHQLAPYVWKAA